MGLGSIRLINGIAGFFSQVIFEQSYLPYCLSILFLSYKIGVELSEVVASTLKGTIEDVMPTARCMKF